MIGDEIKDYHLLKAIRKKLTYDPVNRFRLRSIFFCGSKTPPNKKYVALLANKNHAKFYGLTTCKSPWACPVCTAKQMAKYGADIACALDALKEKNLLAAMFTFTIPHSSGFSCEDSTEILYNSWKNFVIHGNTVNKIWKNDVFANFMQEFQSKHRVRVCEYTWGSAGWHPHFHCLFWFPADKFQKILDWEPKLQERWLQIVKRETIKQLSKHYSPDQKDTLLKRIEIMYNNLNDISKPLYISKTSDNKVIVQNSSTYLSGWGGDRELTANVKNIASHNDHYTWQQILQKAIELDKLKSDDEKIQPVKLTNDKNDSNFWWNLYFEYAWYTKKYKHARINFSVHSGLKDLIKLWKTSNQYKLFLKKKNTEAVQKNGLWKTVALFYRETWYQIWCNDLESDILKLARAPDALQKINSLLAKHNINPAFILDNVADVAEKCLNEFLAA